MFAALRVSSELRWARWTDRSPVLDGHAATAGNPRKLESLEAARGIAALLVVFHHVGHHLRAALHHPFLDGVTTFGHAGVDFFFVLSGFIILTVHGDDIGRPHRIGHYLNRRFSRVFPFYWIVLAVSLIMAAASRTMGLPTPSHAVMSILLIPYPGGPAYGVAWTLQFEVFFYGCFAILIISRRFGLSLLACWFALAAIGLARARTSYPLAFLANAYNVEFALGMAAAWILRRWRLRAPHWIAGLGLAGFAMSAAAEDAGWLPGLHPLARLCYGIPSMALVVGLVACERQGWLRIPAFLRRLGGASYALYLCHVPWIGTCYKLLALSGLIALPTAIIAGILVLSAVSGSLWISAHVEMPAMALSRDVVSRLSAQLVAARQRIAASAPYGTNELPAVRNFGVRVASSDPCES